MAKYRRKSVVVEAVKITRTITITTSEGKMVGNPGDYLITDQNGEQYPLDAHTFEDMYEKIKDSSDVKGFFRKALSKLKQSVKGV
ncbi:MULTISPECIES: hypothetical protein [Bacillaceae]|uniref:hypothetical protein n=1 Tax=Bacillaceae TaxID=186817 RepID=UPI0006864D36|nr:MULTISPECIES: hypothetical protein [Bacillaceae]UOE92473.1 hypothetical protein MM271_14625 [Alkalihalobacillus sp. LMS39]